MNGITSHNNKVLDFQAALTRIYSTVDGKFVLDILKDTNVKSTSVSKDPHLTYYYLGRSELIASLFDIISKHKT